MSTYPEQTYPSAPFPTTRSARTLALLMNQQQRTEIGQRIRELRMNSAETNRSIAEYVGVTPDAVKAWIAGRGISYDNAEKVAELFGIDVDYIWRGRLPGETPALIESLDSTSLTAEDAERLRRVEEKLDEILERLRRLEPAEPAGPDTDLPAAPDSPPEDGDAAEPGTG